MSWGSLAFVCIAVLILICGSWGAAGDMWQDPRRWVQIVGVLIPVGLFTAGAAACVICVAKLTE